MQFPIKSRFKLTDGFVEKYKHTKPPFGFNGLGEFVYLRTYSRIKLDGKNEMWYETVRRVVEGIYSIQKEHIESYNLGWNQSKAQKSAQEMYDRIFNFKMLPAGRSLWAMGSDVVMEKGLSESLYNCSFISTENINEEVGKPFANAMDFLMCGVGVGADVAGANKVKVKSPSEKVTTYIIPDTREGWCESLRLLINSYFGNGNTIHFDYSEVRPEGAPIKTFGGVASGAKPLIELHEKTREILNSQIDQFLTARNITDIFNLIGKAVVAGNVRRSAEIIIGNPTEEFLDLKNYEKNPDRMDFGWASNNTVIAELGMDYKDIAKRIAINGEPGIFWLENAKKYGRVRSSEAEYKDNRISGLNPCGEITLESNELCNLCELFPANHESLDDFKTTIKFAYLYAKTITLLNTHWQDTNRVMLRNRRIGLSMTGIVQFVAKVGMNESKKWMREGYTTAKYYDKVYSEWFAVPESIKITTVKPSGTLSLLAGATPGIHFPENNYYIRRVRLAKNSQFVNPLLEAGYHIEPAVGQEESTVVVEFPVAIGDTVRTVDEVTMWEQLALASFLQENWADNSVSITVSFDPEKEGQDIENALNLYQFKLKAVSFLPKIKEGAYQQMPYEKIDKETYNRMKDELLPLDFSSLFSQEAEVEKYCSNDGCSVL